MDIACKHVSHAFDSLPVLQDLSADIPSGQFTALIGTSGCGKSTFLRILAGLLSPSGGTVTLGGQPPERALAAKRVGFLSQNPALLPWKTVLQNVMLAQRINPQNHRDLHSSETLLEMVGLTDFAAAYPFTLSGGMQQRVALARTLALGADLWLMDEPFAALDELTRERLGAELLTLWTRFHPTVVWVTHHIYEAVRLADRVLVLSPRPARLQADIPIPLPRPRDEASSDFQARVRAIRTALEAGG
ncbi:MAG: ABC transporter ATP-binding protein [Anaerolineales bacterium]